MLTQLRTRALQPAGILYTLGPGCRTFASVAEEMIAFARTNRLAGQTQSVDVLNSGLAQVASKPDQSRLHLGLADIHADTGNWKASAEHASTALELVREDKSIDDPGDLTCEGLRLATNACSASGELQWPKWATWKDQARQDPRMSDMLNLGMRQQALAEGQALDRDMCRKLVDELLQAEASPDLQHRAGLICLVMGWHEDAHSSFLRAGETSRSDLPDDPARGFMPPRAARELQAAALLGRGQALWALKSRQDDALGPRDTAEDILAEAVPLAEQVSGPQHPRVGLVLFTLADVYARSQRITMAEGLFRKAATLLGLQPRLDKADDAVNQLCTTAHPSAAALLAWRYAQLLTALPKRDTEAAAWKGIALQHCKGEQGAWLQTGSQKLEPEQVFGTLDALKGSGNEGAGMALDAVSRRAYHVQEVL